MTSTTVTCRFPRRRRSAYGRYRPQQFSPRSQGACSFCADYGAFGRASRAVRVSVIALIISTPFAGRMFFGKSIHMILGGYSTVAWTLVLLYVLTVWLSVSEARRPSEPRSPG